MQSFKIRPLTLVRPSAAALLTVVTTSTSHLPTGDKISSAAAAGVRVARTIEIVVDTKSESTKYRDDDSDADGGEQELIDRLFAGTGSRFEMTCCVDDVVVVVSGGMPQTLKRTFVSLSAKDVEALPQGENGSVEYRSPLLGRTVVFGGEGKDLSIASWGDVPAKESGKEEGKAISRLVPDVDPRALISTAEVAVGDSWRVVVDRDLLLPLGDLALEDAHGVARLEDDVEVPPVRSSITVTYRGKSATGTALFGLEVQSESQSKSKGDGWEVGWSEESKMNGELEWSSSLGVALRLALEGSSRETTVVVETGAGDQEKRETVSVDVSTIKFSMIAKEL